MKRKYNVKVNGESYEVEVELIDSGDNNNLVSSGASAAFPFSADVRTEATVPVTAGENDLAIRAPMPGTVLKVNVKTGDNIRRGQSVVVLEAMKMENEITAPEDGTVTVVNARDGKAVSAEEVLIYYRK